jgi:hypothetical protein
MARRKAASVFSGAEELAPRWAMINGCFFGSGIAINYLDDS